MRIGDTWNGGVYAGITRYNEHLILQFPHLIKRDVTWSDALKSVAAPWRLPMRVEAALLYANLQDYFDPLWYWTKEDYPPDREQCVWVQTFGYGRQADARMTDACRVCAVRSFPMEGITAEEQRATIERYIRIADEQNARAKQAMQQDKVSSQMITMAIDVLSADLKVNLMSLFAGIK